MCLAAPTLSGFVEDRGEAQGSPGEYKGFNAKYNMFFRVFLFFGEEMCDIVVQYMFFIL